MQIPSNLQDVWKNVSQDKSISVDDYKQIVKTAMPNGLDEELDADESKFITGLSSELKQNGIATKGSVPVGVLSFSPQDAPVKSTEQKPETQTKPSTGEKAPADSEVTPEEKQELTNGLSGLGGNYSYELPKPELPNNTVLLNWQGYNKQVNTAFSTAFGEKPPVGSKVPVLGKGKSDNVIGAFGAGSIGQFQQLVGAKQDQKFGPETYFKTKIHVANEINSSDNIEKMNQLKSIIGVLGDDPEVVKMKGVLDQRIGVVQNYLSTRDVVGNYFNNVNSIVNKANPANMESLLGAKQGLQTEFNKLPEGIKSIQQVDSANTDAMSKVDSAISTLQGNLDNQNITKQKGQLVSELNGVLDKSVMAGLTTGDNTKIKEGKAQVDAAVEKYPQIKDSEDIKGAKSQAHSTLDSIDAKITSTKNLIAKKDWTKEESQLAVKTLGELPPGDFKNSLNKAIDNHSEAAKLKEKARANTSTTITGLHDVIGNGVFNAENPEGTKGMFQLIAKQGLLGETITKMTSDDQTEAIKMLTRDVKFDKMNDDQKFNVGIAKTMFDNLGKSSKVDGEFNKKLLPDLKKQEAPANFDNQKIDLNNYVKGMKFSIGEDRSGSEKEAALTMTRGIIYGQVPKTALGQLNRYELNDLTKFVEKKGNKDEKQDFLKTVSQAYNEGVGVNIESLDKGDKAQVIKNLLDTPNPNETKITDMLNKSGNKVTLDLVKNKNLNDNQLVLIAKHTDGQKMADEPEAAAKLLMAMIKTYNNESAEGKANSTVKIDDIRSFIGEIGKNGSIFQSRGKEAMSKVISQLGDGPDSEYGKFQKLAPSTLDKIRDIAE